MLLNTVSHSTEHGIHTAEIPLCSFLCLFFFLNKNMMKLALAKWIKTSKFNVFCNKIADFFIYIYSNEYCDIYLAIN